MQYVTERNGGVECLQCSLMSPSSTCRDAKLHRSAPQTPEGKKKKRNCEICLDRKNEDRQEEKIGF